MLVKELIEHLQRFEDDTPICIKTMVQTPNGQVVITEVLDTVCNPVEYGPASGSIVLCNWNDPAIELSDLKTIY